MIAIERPLDALNQARNKRVIIELKNKREFIGTLKAFDMHLNTVLDDAEEREDGKVVKKMGRVLVRGDTILFINPA